MPGGALGYTHLFNPKTILNFRYGYTWLQQLCELWAVGSGFVDAMGFTAQDSRCMTADTSSECEPGQRLLKRSSNFAIPLGPVQTMDYHLDLSKVVGNHTIGVGGMYYHIRGFDDGWGIGAGFSPVGTAQDGTANNTGFSPASFMLGTLDSYAPWVGSTGADQP